MNQVSAAVQYTATAAPALDAIIAIWREVLECTPGQIEANSNLFLSGGDSLALARVLIRVRERLGVQLDLRMPASFSTPAKMAGCVVAAASLQSLRVATDAGLFIATGAERFPASEGQAALWYAEQMAPGSGLYNTAVILRLSGELHIAVLTMALNALLHRHEMLRARLTPGTRAQRLDVVIAPEQQVCLDPEPFLCADPREHFRELAAEPFDLAAGPLWRFRLVTTGKRAWALLLCLHHCISDGWSGPILLRSLADSYNALLRDPQWTAPAPEREFRYYCLEQQANVGSELAWWQRQLAGPGPSSAWPCTGVLRWPFAMTDEEVLLPQASIARAQQATASSGVQLSAFLMTALRFALRSLTGIAEFCLGLPVTTRSSSAQELGVGYFVNLVMLRARIDPATAYLALLHQVQQGLDEALLHRHLPFPTLVRTLAPAVLPSGNLWCDILFAFQNSPLVTPSFSGMRAELETLTLPYAQYPFKVEILRSAAGWTCRCEYAAEVFAQGEVPRLLALFNYYIAQLAGALQVEQ
ncbi:MAG: hypothetical protein RLZZ227_388 [Pseudomonadota bacterium]|jgi:acyl carrier protein